MLHFFGVFCIFCSNHYSGLLALSFSFLPAFFFFAFFVALLFASNHAAYFLNLLAWCPVSFQVGACFLICLCFAFMTFPPKVITILATAFVVFLLSCCKHSCNCVLAFLLDFLQLACLFFSNSQTFWEFAWFVFVSLFSCLLNFCFLTFLLL